MQLLLFLILYIPLLHQVTVHGNHFRKLFPGSPVLEMNYDDSSLFPTGKNFKTADNNLSPSNESSKLYNNVSEIRIEQENLESSSEMLTDESSLQSNQLNSTLILSNASQPTAYSTDNVSNTVTPKMSTMSEIFGNESQLPTSVQYSSSESSINTINGKTNSSVKSNNLTTSPNPVLDSSSPTTDDEPEGVARGKPNITENTGITVSKTETIYQKTLALMSDTYVLSILIPVAAGVVFASTIIIIIAICRCLRKRCRRRRLRRKVLPDSVKNLRPSDRARLLAESSDEEF